MTQVEAIYRGGVFEPLEPVNLPEEQRVRLNIDSTQRPTVQQWFTNLRKRHDEFIRKHGTPLPDSTPLIAADRMR